MNAIAKVDQGTLPGMPEPATPSMFELIMRAVKDPACDPTKMAQLLELSRQVRADDAKAAYTSALVALKPLLPVIDRKGRITITDKADKSKVIQSTPYALWEDIDAAITPILHDYGFVLTFRCGSTGAPEHRVTVTGVLSHEMGHSEETTMTLPMDTSGSKNNVQAVGSSTSYGKRYTAGLLLNLRTKGEDDDGKLGGDPGTISEDQAETILGLLTRDKADVQLFCKSMKVDNILEIPSARFREAVERINTRSAALAQKKGAASMEPK